MYITLTDTFENKVNKAIRIAKEHKIPVIFERDGEHGTADLTVLLKFQNEGFEYRIYGYESKFDKNAIKVEFIYRGNDNEERGKFE